MRILGTIVLVLLSSLVVGQSAKQFSTWNELQNWVIQNAVVMQVNAQQLQLANLTETAAWLNTLNPRVPTTASLINNTDLPVNFIPGQVFGGPEGSFREVTFGQQYISSFTAAPQLDLINVSKWQDVRVAEANTEVVKLETVMSRKRLLEEVNVMYCSIVQLQSQRDLVEKFATLSDSLAIIVGQKYQSGLVRLQDWNDAKINVLQQRGLLRNLEHQLVLQYSALSSIVGSPVSIDDAGLTLESKPSGQSQTALNLALQRVRYSKMMYRSAQLEQLPVLSFQSSLAYQNNSNLQWMDPASRWIFSSFVGAKLTWDLPTNAVKATNVRIKKINYQLAELVLKDETRKQVVINDQLRLDYENAVQELNEKQDVERLEKDSYRQIENQYNQEIVGLDKLIIGQNKWLNAQMNLLSAKVNTKKYLQKQMIHYAN